MDGQMSGSAVGVPLWEVTFAGSPLWGTRRGSPSGAHWRGPLEGVPVEVSSEWGLLEGFPWMASPGVGPLG